MSVLEIKHQIERLSPDEQAELESFLKARCAAESPVLLVARIACTLAAPPRPSAVGGLKEPLRV